MLKFSLSIISSVWSSLERHAVRAGRHSALVAMAAMITAGCSSSHQGNDELLQGNLGVSLEIVSGNNQARTTNQVYTNDLVVRAIDTMTNSPVSALAIEFRELTDTRGEVLTPLAFTDANGIASTKMRSGPVTDATVQVEARIKDTNTAALFDLRTLGSGMGTRYALTTSGGGVEVAGRPFSFIVTVEDENGKVVTEHNTEVDFQWSFEWSAVRPVNGWTPNGVSWGGMGPTLPQSTETIHFTNGVYISDAKYVFTDKRAKALVFAGDGDKGMIDVFAKPITILPNSTTMVGFADAPGGPDAGAKYFTGAGSDATPDIVTDADRATALSIYAVSMDAFGNYSQDISASWSVSQVAKESGGGNYPDILTGYLSPAVNLATYVVDFSPTRSGRAKLSASASGLTAGSRVVHVNHGAPSKLAYNIYDKSTFPGVSTPIALSASRLPVAAGKKFLIEITPTDAKGNVLDQKYNTSPSADSGAFSGTANVRLKWQSLPQLPVVSGGNTPSIVRDGCTGPCDVMPDTDTTITFVDGIPNVKLVSYLNVATPSGDGLYAQLVGTVSLQSGNVQTKIENSVSPQFSVSRGTPAYLNLYRTSNTTHFDTLRKATGNHVFPGAITPSPNDPGPYGNTTQSPLRTILTGESDTYRLGIEDEGGNLFGFIDNTANVSFTLYDGWLAGTKPAAWSNNGGDSSYLLKYAPQVTATGSIAITLSQAQIASVVSGYTGDPITTTFGGSATPNDLKYFAINVFDTVTENTNLTSTSPHYLALWFRDQYDNVLAGFMDVDYYMLTVTYSGAVTTTNPDGSTCATPVLPAPGPTKYKIKTKKLNNVDTPILHIEQGAGNWVPATYQLPKTGTSASIRVTGLGVRSQKSFTDTSDLVPNVLPGEAVSLRIERILPNGTVPSNQNGVGGTLKVTCSSPYIFTARTYDQACNPKDNVDPAWKIVDPATGVEITPNAEDPEFRTIISAGDPGQSIPPNIGLEAIHPIEAGMAVQATFTLPNESTEVRTGGFTFTPGDFATFSITRDSASPSETAGQDFTLTIKQSDCAGNLRTNFSSNSYMAVSMSQTDGSPVPDTTANPRQVAKSPVFHNNPIGGTYPFSFTEGVSTGNKFTFYNASYTHRITLLDQNNGAPVTKYIDVPLQNAAIDHFKVTHDTPETKWRAGTKTQFTVDAYDLYENRILTTPQPSITIDTSGANLDQTITDTNLSSVSGLDTKTVTGTMSSGAATFKVLGKLIGAITPTITSGTATQISYPTLASAATSATVFPEKKVYYVRWAANKTLASSQTAGAFFKNTSGTVNGAAVTLHDRFGNHITETLNANGDKLRVYLKSTTANRSLPANYDDPGYHDALYQGVLPLDSGVLTDGLITVNTETWEATLDNFKYASALADNSVKIEIRVAYEDTNFLSDGSGGVGSTPRELPLTDITILQGTAKYVFGLLKNCQGSDFIHGVLSFPEAIQTYSACTNKADEPLPLRLYVTDEGFNPIGYNNASLKVRLKSTDPNAAEKQFTVVPPEGQLVDDPTTGFYSPTANWNPHKKAPTFASTWYLDVSASGLTPPPAAATDPDNYSPEVLPGYTTTAGSATRSVALIDNTTAGGATAKEFLDPGKTSPGITSATIQIKAGTAYKVNVVVVDKYYNQVGTYPANTLRLTHDDPSVHATPAYAGANGYQEFALSQGARQFTFTEVTAQYPRSTYNLSCGALENVATACTKTLAVEAGDVVRTLVYFSDQHATQKGGQTSRADSIAPPAQNKSFTTDNDAINLYVVGVDTYFNRNTNFVPDASTQLGIPDGDSRASFTDFVTDWGIPGAFKGVYKTTLTPAQLINDQRVKVLAPYCLTYTGDTEDDICRSDLFDIKIGAPAKALVLLPNETLSEGWLDTDTSHAIVRPSPTSQTDSVVDVDYTATVYVTDRRFNWIKDQDRGGTLYSADPNITSPAFTLAGGTANVTFKHRTASTNTGASESSSLTHKLYATVSGLTLSSHDSNTYTVKPNSAVHLIARLPGQSWKPGKSALTDALPARATTYSTTVDSSFNVDVLALDKYFNVDTSFTSDALVETPDDPSDTEPTGTISSGHLQVTVNPITGNKTDLTMTPRLSPAGTLTEHASDPYDVGHGAAKYLFVTHPAQTFDSSKGFTDPSGGIQISNFELEQSAQRAATSFNATLWLTDRYGNLVKTGTSKTLGVTLRSTDVNFPTAYPSGNIVDGTGSATIAIENRTAGNDYKLVPGCSATCAAITMVESSIYDVKAGPAYQTIAILPGQVHSPGKSVITEAIPATPAPTMQTAGTAFDVTVMLVDKYFNQVDPAFADSYATAHVNLTTSDPRDTDPAAGQFTDGATTFSVTDIKATDAASSTGPWTVTATVPKADLGTAPEDFTHISSQYAVKGGTAKYVITELEGQTYDWGFQDGIAKLTDAISGTMTSTTTDDTFTVKLRAVDDYLNVAQDYNGAVSISTEDPTDIETDYSGNFASGVKEFTVSPVTATKDKVITVTAPGFAAENLKASSTYTIKEGAPAHFVLVMDGQLFHPGQEKDNYGDAVTGTPNLQEIGTAFSVDVYGTDSEFNQITTANYPAVDNGFTITPSDPYAEIVTGSLDASGKASIQITNYTGNDPDPDNVTDISALVATPSASYPMAHDLTYKVKARSASQTIILVGNQTHTPGTSDNGNPVLTPATPADVVVNNEVNIKVIAVDDYFNRVYDLTSPVTLTLGGTDNTFTAQPTDLTKGAATYTVKSTKAEAKTLLAGLTPAVATNHGSSLNVIAGDPNSVLAFDGDGTTATVDTDVAIKVKVLDLYSNPVPNTAVTYSVVEQPDGGGASAPADGTTSAVVGDDFGIASATFRLGTVAGTYKLKADVAGTDGVTFTLTAEAGSATKLGYVTPTDPILAKQSPPVEIRALDTYNNVDTKYSMDGSKQIVLQKKPASSALETVGTVTLTNGVGSIDVPHSLDEVVTLSFAEVNPADPLGLDISATTTLTYNKPATLAIDGGATYDFGSHENGAIVTRTFTVTNSGTVPATNMMIGGLAAPFTTDGGTCGTELAESGATCTVVLKFTPSEQGSFSDSITIDYDDGVETVQSTQAVQGETGVPGTLDNRFNSAGTPRGVITTDISSSADTSFASAIDSNGRVVVVGARKNSGLGQTNDVAVARYTRIGQLDPDFKNALAGNVAGKVSFDVNAGNDVAHAVAVDPLNNIYLAGQSEGLLAYGTMVVIKLNESGTFNSGFGSGSMQVIDTGELSDGSAIEIADSSIYVAGTSGTQIALTRLALSNGAIDDAFGTSGVSKHDVGADTYMDTVRGIKVTADAIYVAGTSYGDEFGNSKRFFVAKFDLTGAFIDEWTVAIGTANSLAGFVIDDRDPGVPLYYLGGTSDNQFAIARLIDDPLNPGELILDTAFNGTGYLTASPAGDARIAAGLKVDSDGRIVLAGHYKPAAADFDFTVMRFDGLGVPDATFGTGGIAVFDLQGSKPDEVSSVLIEPEHEYTDGDKTVKDRGKILLVGRTFTSTYDFAVTRVFK